MVSFEAHCGDLVMLLLIFSGHLAPKRALLERQVHPRDAGILKSNFSKILVPDWDPAGPHKMQQI